MYYLYAIVNKINDKIYIGQTVNPRRRWTMHKNRAKHKPLQYIHYAMIKYGIENFTYEVISMCKNQLDADETEVQLIKQYNSCDKEKGYNISPGGDPAWNRGLPPERQPMYGKKQSEFQKQRVIEVHTGKTFSHTQEWKDNLSKIMIGRKFTKEWKNNLSMSQRMFSPEKEREIVQLYEKGISVEEISLKFDCSKVTVYNTIKRLK
jgi:group I intron endonuclease